MTGKRKGLVLVAIALAALGRLGARRLRGRGGATVGVATEGRR